MCAIAIITQGTTTGLYTPFGGFAKGGKNQSRTQNKAQ